jgi:hypothetical protein
MTYSAGNTVLAADFNAFHSDVEDIFEDNNSNSVAAGALIFGYGETLLQATVSAGNTITAAQWNNLFMMVHRSAAHQGTTVTLGGSVSAGPYSAGGTIGVDSALATDIAAIRTNKLNFAVSEMTTATMTNQAKTGTATWSSSCVHTFTQTFTSYDVARHFYNQGGAAQFAFTRSGGSSNAQNTAWTDLGTAVGTVTMGVNTTTQSGSGGTAGDSFDDIVGNAGTTRTIWTQASGGSYASNNYKVQCNCNAAKEVYTWTITFTDGHTNGFFDSVDGTLASTATERRSTGTYINSAAPSYNTGSYTQA